MNQYALQYVDLHPTPKHPPTVAQRAASVVLVACFCIVYPFSMLASTILNKLEK